MESISSLVSRLKSGLGLAQGVEIIIRTVDGNFVHGRTMVRPHGLNNLLRDENAISGTMRVAEFTRQFAQCVGAQLGAEVVVRFDGRDIDGRRALYGLQAAPAQERG